MDGPCYIVLATTVMLHVVGNLSFKDYFGTFQGPIFVGLVAGVPAIKRILLNRIICGICSAQYYKVVYVVTSSRTFHGPDVHEMEIKHSTASWISV